MNMCQNKNSINQRLDNKKIKYINKIYNIFKKNHPENKKQNKKQHCNKSAKS